MVQIIEQTHEEKVAMYMKQPKKKLAEMLANCNLLLDRCTKQLQQYSVSGHVCEHEPIFKEGVAFTGANSCIKCGQAL